MDLKIAIGRARRGLREDRRLYVVAVSSLTIAFLCLGVSLLVTTNLSELAERWGRSSRMTIYVGDGVEVEHVRELELLLTGLSEVRRVDYVTAAQAREDFLTRANVDTELAALPPDVFPASLEVTLADGVAVQRLESIASRVERFAVVEGVESYRGWFTELESLLSAGRGLAIALAMLVVVCVIAVVSNTIRLAVAGRRREIEVMKLCGATDGFVRGPFVLEGALQGFAAAVLSLLLLLLAFALLQSSLDASIASLTGVRMVFLTPGIVALIALGGAGVGALGSLVSLRRYLAV